MHCRCSQNCIAIWTVWPSGGLSRPLIGYELPDHVYESNGPLSTRQRQLDTYWVSPFQVMRGDAFFVSFGRKNFGLRGRQELPFYKVWGCSLSLVVALSHRRFDSRTLGSRSHLLQPTSKWELPSWGCMGLVMMSHMTPSVHFNLQAFGSFPELYPWN